ncbi:lipopolysaccharide biosynthesis protein [Boudabousia marimammalium]|uniref:Polysaccharide biosynthesis protein n=1 Tax=Boudabousia marimammalium TaxID=156892 RepID=A0A1Q5PS44_9ACTO|nr:hypothetical protein [Boudabousia marimammalium]OKL50230.1 hypothetical protein BM477_02215 [Boudabousia marimammalium]
MKEWLKRRVSGSPFLKHMLTLVSGTAAAQAVGLLLQPILGRLYTPEVTGELAVYMSVTAIVISIAALRYDMTIMLPDTDDEARQLKRLSTRSILVVAFITTMAAMIAYPFIVDRYGVISSRILLVAGVSVFLVADSAAIQYWLNRKLNYKAIAINRAQQSIGILVTQIGLGFAGVRSVLGLLIGMIVGQAAAWITIFRKSADVREPVAPETPSMKELAFRYKKMPLLNGPNTLVDAVRFNGIILLLTATFGHAVGGEFFKAWAITEAPVALINGAIAQVFFQQLATVERGKMAPLVVNAIKRALLIGILPFVAMYFVAPYIVPWYLGAQWVNSGYYAQALVPWLYIQLASSPISYIFIVTEQQQRLLGFAIGYAVVPLAFLWTTPYPPLLTVRILAVLMASMLLIMITMSVYSAKEYDRKEPVDDAT